MKYTKEQLIEAQQKYNEKYLNSPEDEIGCIELGRGCAELQIDYLLNFVS